MLKVLKGQEDAIYARRASVPVGFVVIPHEQNSTCDFMIQRFKMWYIKRLISKAIYNTSLAHDLSLHDDVARRLREAESFLRAARSCCYR